MKVLVVGRDRWRGRGFASALADEGDWDVIVSGLDDPPPIGAVRAVILDPFDPVAWDRWRGLTPSGPWARLGRPASTNFVVCTEAPMTTIVRQRMAEVGASAVVVPDRLKCPGDLAALVRQRTIRSVGPAPLDLARAGCRPGSRPGACIEMIADRGLSDVVTSMVDLAESGLSRRAAMALRRDLAGLGRITTATSRSLADPHRDVSLPTWREVVAFVERGLGVRV